MPSTQFQSHVFNPSQHAILFYEPDFAEHSKIFARAKELELIVTIQISSSISEAILDPRYTYLGTIISLSKPNCRCLLKDISFAQLLLSLNYFVFTCSNTTDFGSDYLNQLICSQLPAIYPNSYYHAQSNPAVAMIEIMDKLHLKLLTGVNSMAKFYQDKLLPQ